MKKLLTTMILYFQIGHTQCFDSKYKYNYYDNLEVLNLHTDEYEVFNKDKVVYTSVEVNQNKSIDLLFKIGNTEEKIKSLLVWNCQNTDSTIIYDCYDYEESRNCRLIFGKSIRFYELTIRYMEPITVFKVKRDK